MSSTDGGVYSDSETTAKNQFPQASFSSNYDNAWDVRGNNSSGITNSNQVLQLRGRQAGDDMRAAMHSDVPRCTEPHPDTRREVHRLPRLERAFEEHCTHGSTATHQQPARTARRMDDERRMVRHHRRRHCKREARMRARRLRGRQADSGRELRRRREAAPCDRAGERSDRHDGDDESRSHAKRAPRADHRRRRRIVRFGIAPVELLHEAVGVEAERVGIRA